LTAARASGSSPRSPCSRARCRSTSAGSWELVAGDGYLPLGAASFCTSTSSTRPYSLASMALMK
jgi:hypothetical protein